MFEQQLQTDLGTIAADLSADLPSVFFGNVGGQLSTIAGGLTAATITSNDVAQAVSSTPQIAEPSSIFLMLSGSLFLLCFTVIRYLRRAGGPDQAAVLGL
jgi:hypothetical protein